MHDVGHAPFSHTGERFYLDEKMEYTKLHKELSDVVGSNSFSKDLLKEKRKSAAPHEVMSAIVGLHSFQPFSQMLIQENFLQEQLLVTNILRNLRRTVC